MIYIYISLYFIVLFEKFKSSSEFTDQCIIDLSDLNLKFFSSVSESLRAYAKFFIATNGFFWLLKDDIPLNRHSSGGAISLHMATVSPFPPFIFDPAFFL